MKSTIPWPIGTYTKKNSGCDENIVKFRRFLAKERGHFRKRILARTVGGFPFGAFFCDDLGVTRASGPAAPSCCVKLSGFCIFIVGCESPMRWLTTLLQKQKGFVVGVQSHACDWLSAGSEQGDTPPPLPYPVSFFTNVFAR